MTHLIELLLSTANFLLDVVVHQIRDVPHEQAHVRQLQRQGLELLRQGQVTLQVVLLQEGDTDGNLVALLQGLQQTPTSSIEAEPELTDFVLK